MNHMNIGHAAAVAGVSPKMIRHYESLGMIPDVQRTDAGYRLYSSREVDMLRFIRQSRTLGFSVKQIESLLALWRDDHRASREVKELAQRQLADIEERQRELDEMRVALSALVAKCPGNEDSHCAILEELSASAAPAQAIPVRRAVKTLKQVRAGSTTETRKKPGRSRPTTPDASPISGLMAWSRGLASDR